MANGMENPKCPICGQPLDIVIENGVRKINACTNPNCEEQQPQDDHPRKNNSYT